ANAELAARLETMGVEPSRLADAAPRGASETSISVIVPVYNEAQNIPLLVERLFAVLDGLGRAFEVIAVNDGSTDRSLDALRAAGVQGGEPRAELRSDRGHDGGARFRLGRHHRADRRRFAERPG